MYLSFKLSIHQSEDTLHIDVELYTFIHLSYAVFVAVFRLLSTYD